MAPAASSETLPWLHCLKSENAVVLLQVYLSIFCCGGAASFVFGLGGFIFFNNIIRRPLMLDIHNLMIICVIFIH